ncbi:MAG: hypothetical protein V4625_15900 [Pseudomonadota bacterium]
MDTSSIILLAVSASISFALGRTVVYFRDKKRKAEKERREALAEQALRDGPPEAESKNKSKRKRQLSQQAQQKNRP